MVGLIGVQERPIDVRATDLRKEEKYNLYSNNNNQSQRVKAAAAYDISSTRSSDI